MKNKKVIPLARVHVEARLRETKGRFFGVTFRKKDASVRKMNARFGVTKGLKGGKNTVEKGENAYITAWDRQQEGFRTINMDTVTELNINGNHYEVI